MKFELEAHVAYKVTITNLEQVPAEADLWKGLLVVRMQGDPDLYDANPGCTLTDDERAFEAEWASEVVRTAIDMLPMHGPLEGAHFYLGHFNDPSTPTSVVVLGKEMDNYGADDITYNGWRVTVSAEEISWGYEGV